MKNKSLWIYGPALLLPVFLLCNSCSQKKTDVTGEIQEANAQFMEDFSNGDANAVAAHYTEDGSIYPPNNEVLTGHEAIANFWGGAMNSGVEKVLLETVTAEGYGDLAIEEGRYKLYTTGDQMIDQGKYLVTWKKENNEWKLVRDIWNTSNPSMTETAQNEPMTMEKNE
jgi:uncharacterized protein (TIGR02246 family)